MSENQLEAESTAPDFVKIEHQILDFWNKTKAFEQLLERAKTNPKRFDFLDGPITANNPMGVHHAWGRSLKDIFIRYHNLLGESGRYQNGFDCQGLWVEVEVEKELGFRGKPDIENYGIENFSKACKERVLKFSKIQTEQSKRLGQWMDWDHSYYTYSDKNIESIWHFLKICHEKSWLYQSGLPMLWCSRCGTSLSEHEMSGSYQTVKHLAVYIKLQVPSLKSRILVWTTTPWTLAANTALAVNPELTYVSVQLAGEKEPLIMAKPSFEALKFKKAEIVQTYSGKDLIGLAYEAIFPELPVQKDFEHKIVPWKEVDGKEGSGVVHIAPGCGREDFDLGVELNLTRLCPIDERGIYTNGYGFLEGKDAKEVATLVADSLERDAKLFKRYEHEHSYPVCWRCKNELLFRVVNEWFISCKEVRPLLIAAAKKVDWQPEHVGKRMEDWLNNMGDWCISRKRYWGLPLPFYPCPTCSTLTVVGSQTELDKLASSKPKLPELHKPWIDDVCINCPKCNTQVKRVTEVGDCWLDAGIVPFSTRPYFESKEAKQNWCQVDWICEMSEQVRLWFYSMLFMGVTLEGKAPYERVLTYERVLSEEGAKFSKTGYMIKFDEASEKMGVDAMRYYFASQSPTNDLRFGYTRGADSRRQLISFWNIVSFFKTYAEIDKPDFSKLAKQPFEDRMDQWLLAKTEAFVSKAKEGFDAFNTPLVVREFDSFLDQVSNWYVRANRRRFWKSEESLDKLQGYYCLFLSIRAATLAMSPIIPFLTEHVWQTVIRKFSKQETESVHLSSWPEVETSWRNQDLLEEALHVQRVLNHGHRIRAEAQLKVRQPLATLYVVASEGMAKAVKNSQNLILNELNVKALEFVSDKSKFLTERIELDLKKAGPVLKGELQKAVQIVNALSESDTAQLLPQIKAQAEIKLPGLPLELPAAIFVLREKSMPGLAMFEDAGLAIALDTKLTPELEEEGWIRDILRQCQVLRKESGFRVQDKIFLRIQSSNPSIANALKKNKALIESETLAELSSAELSGKAHSATIEIADSSINIAMQVKG